MDAVKTFGGCPSELVTDLGTENKIMASTQAFFRKDENAHKYICCLSTKSPKKQIELDNEIYLRISLKQVILTQVMLCRRIAFGSALQNCCRKT